MPSNTIVKMPNIGSWSGDCLNWTCASKDLSIKLLTPAVINSINILLN